MARYRGRSVRKAIVRFYTHKKHYSAKKANYIAGAVAFSEQHRKKRKHKRHKR